MPEPWRVRRDGDGRFQPGSGGRPPGARNKVSRRVAQAIFSDFDAHKHEVLPRLRQWFVPQYVSLIARLMPRHGEAELPGEGRDDAAGDGLGDGLDSGIDEAAAARLLAAAKAAFDRIEAGEGALADLEAALAGPAADGAGDAILG